MRCARPSVPAPTTTTGRVLMSFEVCTSWSPPRYATKTPETWGSRERISQPPLWRRHNTSRVLRSVPAGSENGRVRRSPSASRAPSSRRGDPRVLGHPFDQQSRALLGLLERTAWPTSRTRCSCAPGSPRRAAVHLAGGLITSSSPCSTSVGARTRTPVTSAGRSTPRRVPARRWSTAVHDGGRRNGT